MSKRVTLLTMALALAIAWVVFAFRQSLKPATSGEPMNGSLASQVGKPVEDFALKDENGKTVHLSDYRGKIIPLVFYASW